jgi:hypothetical protein
VSAVIILLAVLGIAGLVMKVTGRLPPPPPRALPARRHRHWQHPHFHGTYCGDCMGCPCDCCVECCCRCGAGGCESGAACDCLSSIGGGGCECGEAGVVMLPLLLAVLVVFALIGIFVGIFFSTIIFQRIVQRHVHLLQMRSEAQRLVVVDLDRDPECGSAGRRGGGAASCSSPPASCSTSQAMCRGR